MSGRLPVLFASILNVLSVGEEITKQASSYELPRAGRELLSATESLLGRKILVEEIDRDNLTFAALSTIQPDGRPYIALGKHDPYKTTSLVHELVHLKLRAEGYPRYSPLIDTVPRDELVRICNYLLAVVNRIQHAKFVYPILRKHGMNPSANATLRFNHALRSFQPAGDNVFRTLGVVSAIIDCDPSIAKKLRKEYDRHGLQNTWAQGARIAQQINAATINDPRDEAQLAMSIMNQLLASEYSLEIDQWEMIPDVETVVLFRVKRQRKRSQ